jgi:hypothetical protein
MTSIWEEVIENRSEEKPKKLSTEMGKTNKIKRKEQTGQHFFLAEEGNGLFSSGLSLGLGGSSFPL